MEPIVVDPSEAARIMGLSRSTVYKLIGGGDIDSFSICGRKRLITVESIRAWIARKTSEAKA